MWIFWPFNKKNFGSAQDICADFRDFIEPHVGKFIIYDEKHLPHSKQAIFESICIILMTETKSDILAAARLYAFELAFFQKSVGDLPLYPLGINMDRFEVSTMSSQTLANLTRTNPLGKERYDRFKTLRDADWARMKATIGKIQIRSK